MLKIIHVEDDPDILEIVALSLSLTDDIALFQFTSVEEAIQAAMEIGPDLVLSDVMMPRVSGPDMLRQMKQVPRLKDVPVVFVTARVLTSEVEGFLKSGASAVIAKPFDPVTLGEQVISILRGSHERRALEERQPATTFRT